MGAITTKCYELTVESCNYEERRTKGKLISRINWFDAIDCKEGNITTGNKEDRQIDTGSIEERKYQAINDIP